MNYGCLSAIYVQYYILIFFLNNGIVGYGKTVQHNGTAYNCEIICIECYIKNVFHILEFTGI